MPQQRSPCQGSGAACQRQTSSGLLQWSFASPRPGLPAPSRQPLLLLQELHRRLRGVPCPPSLRP